MKHGIELFKINVNTSIAEIFYIEILYSKYLKIKTNKF